MDLESRYGFRSSFNFVREGLSRLARESVVSVIHADGTVLYGIDVVNDPRWITLVSRHPHASIFHTVEWLEALRGRELPDRAPPGV